MPNAVSADIGYWNPASNHSSLPRLERRPIPIDQSSSSLFLFSALLHFAMPSLRRTFSSPPARRAPYYYPSALSSSALQTRPAPHQPRRSSGSDVANRRVLADIDWWIVQDGQRDIYDASTGGRTFTDASENDSDVEPRATPAPAEGVDALLSAWQPTPSVAVTSPERLPVPYFGDITMEGGIGVGSSEVSLFC